VIDAKSWVSRPHRTSRVYITSSSFRSRRRCVVICLNTTTIASIVSNEANGTACTPRHVVVASTTSLDGISKEYYFTAWSCCVFRIFSSLSISWQARHCPASRRHATKPWHFIIIDRHRGVRCISRRWHTIRSNIDIRSPSIREVSQITTNNYVDWVAFGMTRQIRSSFE